VVGSGRNLYLATDGQEEREDEDEDQSAVAAFVLVVFPVQCQTFAPVMTTGRYKANQGY
jgi:hypothetical protein